ncbi:MAG: hypothetical protein V2A64_06060 [Candidatus Omnitrophota bacterium]
MDKRIKLIIFGLIAFLVISIVLNLQTLNSKQAVEQERDKLVEKNTALEKKFNDLSEKYQRSDGRISSLTKDLERVSKEKEEIQSKYESLDKVKEDLVERLKSLNQKPEIRVTVPTPPSGGQEAIPPPPQSQSMDNYWAGILKAKTTMELELENIRNELKNLQISNEQIQREKSALELEVKSLNIEKQDLKRQLEYTQKQVQYNQNIIDNISLELVGEKNDRLQTKDDFKTIKNDNEVLRRQLNTLNSQKINLEKKAQEFSQENSRFEKKFNEVDISLKDKIIELDVLKKQLVTGLVSQPVIEQKSSSSIELPPIVVRPQTNSGYTARETPFLQSKVLSVNRDNNFVVIDLGEDSGVKAGNTFKVYRDKRLIAVLEVIRVAKTVSACDIKDETSPIKIGDTVR